MKKTLTFILRINLKYKNFVKTLKYLNSLFYNKNLICFCI